MTSGSCSLVICGVLLKSFEGRDWERYLPNSTLQLDLYDMSQTESGVRRRKSYDDLCDLQFVPYEASRLFFKAFTDSAITVFCDNLFHGVITLGTFIQK